jgi:hypothetical protein
MIDVRQWVNVETESFVAVASDGKDAIVTLASQSIIKLGVFFSDLPDGLAFVFSEVDDDVLFVDDSGDRTRILR